MAEFFYKAISPQSKKVRGVIKASDEAAARAVLKRQSYLTVSLQEKSSRSLLAFLLKRVSIKDKIIFTEQLGVMIKSGLSVVEALKSLSDETTNRYFKEVILDVKSKVEGGTELSGSLAAYPKVFPEVYIQIVKSGEISGALDEVLARLATQLEKDYDLVSKVKSAMIYPIIITILLIAVIIIIITYIIPKLKDVFAEAGAELPIATRILIVISDIFVKYLWLAVIVFVILFFAFRFVISRGRGQKIWHQLKLKLPVFGNFSKKIILARFTQTFSSLSGAGVPVLKIFETSQNVITNAIIKEDVAKIAQDVKQGVPISFAFKKSRNFPPMVAQLVSVGEKSGEMQEVFRILANFYEKEVDAIARNLSTAIEPIIMIVMGLGVGFIMVSVLQPIYGLVSAM